MVGSPHGSGGGTAVAEDTLMARGVRAQEMDGDLGAGRRWFEAAYREAEQAGHAPEMARALLGLGGLWVQEQRTAMGWGLLRSRAEHVLSLIDPASALALRLRTRLAAESDYRAGEHAKVLAALEEARTSDDATARAEALSLAHHCLLGPDHGPLRRMLAEELIGEAARTGRRSDLLVGLLWQVVDMILDADPHVHRRLGELRALLAERDHLAVDFVVHAVAVMLAIRAGELEKAERLAHECHERGLAADDVDATGWYGAQLVAIRWYQGRLPELVATLTELVDSPTLSAVDNSFFAALAVAAATAGDRRTAAGALATLRGQDLANLPRSSSWLVTMYGVIEAAYLLDNTTAAARAYQLLRPFAHLPVVASLGVACFGSAHHALGVASLTTGDTERAVTHLREAVHANLALAHWPAVVASRLRYAEALLRRGHGEDVTAAAEQRALAEELAQTTGIPLPTATATSAGTGPAGVGATTPSRPPAGCVVLDPAGMAAQCTRHGRDWRVDLGGRRVVVRHSVGMLHLAVLTANPGTEIAAVDLVTGVGALTRSGTNAPQPVLDRAAIQQYRQRLSQLSEEIEDLQARGDHAAAARAGAERDWLLAELTAGTGLGGRSRAFSDGSERARLAVGKAIRRAIAYVEQADAAIGAHLRAAVYTGTRCWYRPT